MILTALTAACNLKITAIQKPPSGGFFYDQGELGMLATKWKCLAIQLLGLGVITSAQIKLS
jgi:hypothetical protein